MGSVMAEIHMVFSEDLFDDEDEKKAPVSGCPFPLSEDETYNERLSGLTQSQLNGHLAMLNSNQRMGTIKPALATALRKFG